MIIGMGQRGHLKEFFCLNWNRKKVFVNIILALSFLSFVSQVYAHSLSFILLISASTGEIFLPQGLSLGFGGVDLNHTITLTPMNATLNATVTSLKVYADRGFFNFISVSDVLLNVSCPLLRFENEMRIEGAAYTQNSIGDFGVFVPMNKTINISWAFYVPSLIDEYFMLGLGLVGLGFMVFAPSWVAWGIKKHGVTEEIIERFGYAMLLFLVGFGLIIMYLWG